MLTKPHHNLLKHFRFFLFCTGIFLGSIPFLPSGSMATETVSFRINYISVEEAKGLAETQLSPSGKISSLLSRSTLVIVDEQENIEQVRNILTKYDMPVPRILLKIKIMGLATKSNPSKKKKSKKLSGGWWEIEDKVGQIRSVSTEKAYLQPNTETRIRMGTVEPIRSDIRHWLETYGLVDSPDMALQTITTGITVFLRQINGNSTRLEITPWLRLKEDEPTVRTDADLEVLTALGTTANPVRPPSGPAPVRLNINPSISKTLTVRHIDISEAAMSIDLGSGSAVNAIAYEGEARIWGDALLSKNSDHRQRIMLLQLQLN